MDVEELVEKIVTAFLALPKRRQQAVRNSFPVFYLVGHIEGGWVAPAGLTAKGRAEVDALARELGVLP